jgi:hypothetical protein
VPLEPGRGRRRASTAGLPGRHFGSYEGLPLGTTDASVVALAERLGLTDVATLDRRHFTVVRPRHLDALTLLP